MVAENYKEVTEFLKECYGNLQVVVRDHMIAENYKEATKLLKERYGNLQALISAYMKHFVMLPNTESVHNVKGFGNLFDKVESSI